MKSEREVVKYWLTASKRILKVQKSFMRTRNITMLYSFATEIPQKDQGNATMAKQKRSKKSEISKIYEFVQLLKQHGVSVSKVILFGSYAKGKSNPDSDIDVAIISTQFGQDVAEEMMMLRKIALKVDSHIEPVPLRPDDLNDNYSTLSQEIRRHGIDIGIAGAPV
jgi:predicted nucleotidyltransferase